MRCRFNSIADGEIEGSPMIQRSKCRVNSKHKFMIISGLVFILIVATQSFNIRQLLQASLLWVESLGVLAPIVFVVIYKLATKKL